MLKKFLGLLGVVCAGAFASPAMADLQIAKATFTVSQSDGQVNIALVRGVNTIGAVSVSYATYLAGGDTAQPGVNYEDTSGTATWDDGDAAAKIISIPIKTAQLNGTKPTFSFKLSNSVGTAIGAIANAQITIIDSTTTVALDFTRSTFTVAEGGNNGAAGATGTFVNLSLNGSLATGAQVKATIIGGTAQAGVDYIDSAIYQVAADQTIQVPLINNSGSITTKSFTVTLQPSNNYTLGSQTSAVVNVIPTNTVAGTISFVAPTVDLTGSFHSKLIEAKYQPQGVKDAEKSIYARANRGGVETDRSRYRTGQIDAHGLS